MIGTDFGQNKYLKYLVVHMLRACVKMLNIIFYKNIEKYIYKNNY